MIMDNNNSAWRSEHFLSTNYDYFSFKHEICNQFSHLDEFFSFLFYSLNKKVYFFLNSWFACMQICLCLIHNFNYFQMPINKFKIVIQEHLLWCLKWMGKKVWIWWTVWYFWWNRQVDRLLGVTTFISFIVQSGW